MDLPRPPPVRMAPTSEDYIGRDRTDDEDEQVDASPCRPRRSNAPDLEDALTRLTQTVERMAAIQQQPALPVADVAEDPDFNWHALRSPLEATTRGSCRGSQRDGEGPARGTVCS